MLEVPREAFVPPELKSIAYMDEPLPVAARADRGEARSLLAPRTFAKLVQLLEIGPDSVVLDIGCATGYSTAVLARLGRRIVAVEVDRALAENARRILGDLGVGHAVVIEGPLNAGALAEAPFDAILLNGSVACVPQPLLEQLADGGRLAAVVAKGPLTRAQVWRRSGKTFDPRAAFEAGADPLPGFAAPAGFVF
jgi:protein-L-isoaspartate(D-aspartate) O-methyltransferase